MKLLEKSTTVRQRSSKQPQALILNIPAAGRDIMEFEHGTSIKIEVCLDENNKKFVKISKED